jgi:uracil-DNA glycosylase
MSRVDETTENFIAAADFQQYRDSRQPVDGKIGEKKIRAFPLYHPAARVSSDLMESGWRAFAKNTRSPARAVKVVMSVN